MIILTGLPLPISINKQLAAVRGRFIKTAAAREYDKSILTWMALNKTQVNNARQWSGKKWIEGHREFKVTLYYCFLRERLISKANTIKRLDTCNRTKSAIDKVVEIVGLDDAHFIEDHGSKVIANDGSEEMIVKIETTRLMDKVSIFNTLNIK